MSRSLLLGGAAAFALCWVALVGCGSRTGFLDGDGLGAPDDGATGDAGSGGSAGSAGAGGLGLAGSSMIGAGGSIGQAAPDVEEPPTPDLAQGCANGGSFEGDVVIFTAADFAQLEGCSEVRGNLQVRARVADLAPLRQLREVTGSLTISRGPQSLAGLENLRQVQDLELDRIVASSLAPLAGLERVRRLSVGGDVPQGNLSGLGGIVNLRELELNGTSLPSLAGLAVPPRMLSITIVDSSPLDLSALDGVSQIDRELVLSNVSGLTTLDGFASLLAVNLLNITANADLVHIDGIASLSAVDDITIMGNPRLEHLPDFGALRRANNVYILANDVLRNVPRFYQSERIVQLLIQNNPALERVVLPTLSAIDSTDDQSVLMITENHSLTTISAASIQTMRRLLIAQNSALTTVELPALQVVADRLDVIRNPLLPSASLGTLLTVTTAQRKIGSNQGDTPLASCPWTNDDRCDETSHVCAAGSDLVDCNAGFPPW